MLLPGSECYTSVRTKLGYNPAARNLLQHLSRRYRIIEPCQTSSLVFTGQEHVHEGQDLRNLLPSLLDPSRRIPIAIKEGATAGSADALQKPEDRLSSQRGQAEVSAEEHKVLREDF